MAEPAAATGSAAFIGAMAAFQPESEKMESYLERVELYILVNNFPDERKVPALLTLIGGHGCHLQTSSLVAPAFPEFGRDYCRVFGGAQKVDYTLPVWGLSGSSAEGSPGVWASK
jgi:hypothetical protein